jgi:hypothetical protein
MNANWHLIFIVAAFICFVLEVFRVQARFNLLAAGFALLCVALLLFPR